MNCVSCGLVRSFGCAALIARYADVWVLCVDETKFNSYGPPNRGSARRSDVIELFKPEHTALPPLCPVRVFVATMICFFSVQESVACLRAKLSRFVVCCQCRSTPLLRLGASQPRLQMGRRGLQCRTLPVQWLAALQADGHMLSRLPACSCFCCDDDMLSRLPACTESCPVFSCAAIAGAQLAMSRVFSRLRLQMVRRGQQCRTRASGLAKTARGRQGRRGARSS
jgi:hypothetical protein